MKDNKKFFTYGIIATISLFVSITLWMIILYNIVNTNTGNSSLTAHCIILLKANALYTLAMALVVTVGMMSADRMDKHNKPE